MGVSVCVNDLLHGATYHIYLPFELPHTHTYLHLIAPHRMTSSSEWTPWLIRPSVCLSM